MPPDRHQTDNLSAAVNKPENPEVFTPRYQSLLSHYRLTGRKIQPGHPNENGDVAQRHHRFKRALDQALMLRGSREFTTRREYKAFLERLFSQLNSNRQERFKEELALLQALTNSRLSACTRLTVSVGMSEIHTQLSQYLKALRLPVFRKSYQSEADLARQESLSHEQYPFELVKRECEERADKRTLRYLRESRLPLEKNLEVFDRLRLPPKVNGLVDLLLEGSFVGRNENVLAFGNPGSGKTHLL